MRNRRRNIDDSQRKQNNDRNFFDWVNKKNSTFFENCVLASRGEHAPFPDIFFIYFSYFVSFSRRKVHSFNLFIYFFTSFTLHRQLTITSRKRKLENICLHSQVEMVMIDASLVFLMGSVKWFCYFFFLIECWEHYELELCYRNYDAFWWECRQARDSWRAKIWWSLKWKKAINSDKLMMNALTLFIYTKMQVQFQFIWSTGMAWLVRRIRCERSDLLL